jgi:immune inhibitor A
MGKTIWISCIILTILAILLCCLVLVVSGVVGYLYYGKTPMETIIGTVQSRPLEPTFTPRVIRATPTAILQNTPEPDPGKSASQATPVPEVASSETLMTMEEVIIPTNDMREMARRLKGVQNIPLTVEPPLETRSVGEGKIFWATNVDSNKPFQVEATLRYVTDHLYFWIEDGVRYREEELRDLAETFEHSIYTTTREFFGSEWTPGVDGDPHLYVLYAGGLGRNLAGYFSSADSYHPLAHPYSNLHEMFLLNADVLRLNDPFTYGVLAHEFQHMIHWYQDRNEASWLNEGFSELAAFLNGYYTGGFDKLYASNTAIQLNDWPNNASITAPHYGASFLFVNYFLGRFGEEMTRSLVAHPDNGLVSVDSVLMENNVLDPVSGEVIGADDIFMDWVVTTYLNNESVEDGRYTYSIYPEAPQAKESEIISSCPVDDETREVVQYGVDYIRITCRGEYTLDFEGSVITSLVPADPRSGRYAFWSNKGDESNMTLTRHFDLRDTRGPLTLEYWTWYDIETDYDYVYVSASMDGERWHILTTPSGTDENPAGNSYGWGYNGVSGGGPKWIHEIVDVSRYAGKEVYLRFEYVTDAAVHGEGFLLDDVGIPEIGYFTDFEADDGGWEAEGFVRIQNILPQTYGLALISMGDLISVERIEIAEDVSVQIPLRIGEDVDEVILIVSGTTRHTRQPAPYRFSIQP